MLGNDYPGQVCSIARSLEVVGERWSLLIVRDVNLGLHRFDELVVSLGVTRTVLTSRLRHLEAEGVLERRAYQEQPARFGYHLTEKGRQLLPVLAHLMWWGDAHYPTSAGPPRLLVHSVCGTVLSNEFRCDECAVSASEEEIRVERGPGLPKER